MQVVADFRPANTGGVRSLRRACAGALRTSSTATATTRSATHGNAVEEGRRLFDELEALMRPPSLRTPFESSRGSWPGARTRHLPHRLPTAWLRMPAQTPPR